MSEPLITIGITCYNEGDWLWDCWQSVLSQTDNRWVAVLVMDGTNHQRTREIFQQIEHPKLRKYAMPCNVGPYPTRNKAFELTETPYHFYVDGDDQLLPNSVALVLDSFEKQPDAGFVYGDFECFGGKQEVWHFPDDVTSAVLIESQPTPGPCAYKKQLWHQLGGFSTQLSRGNGDYDFLIGAAEADVNGYHCGQIFYHYRVGHSSKVSSSYGERYHETHEIIVRRHPRFFSDRRRRNRFLALGYRKAALANFTGGDTKKASRLALMAIYYGLWNDHNLWLLVLNVYLPTWAYQRLLTVWRRGRHGMRVLQKRFLREG